MANIKLRRQKDEGKVALLERASESARRIGGSVETTEGYYCPDCAMFSTPSDTATILPYRVCINCDYETHLSDALTQVLNRMDEKGETAEQAVEAVEGFLNPELLNYVSGK